MTSMKALHEQDSVLMREDLLILTHRFFLCRTLEYKDKLKNTLDETIGRITLNIKAC